MLLATNDGQALLGYSGLGETGAGVEPSEWMAAVLRGRDIPIEEALVALRDAVLAQLPKHLERLGERKVRRHEIIAPAFINGSAHLLSVELTNAKGGDYSASLQGLDEANRIDAIALDPNPRDQDASSKSKG